MQTHDVGGQQANPDGTPLPPPEEHPALRTTRNIEAGQVFTIEPGIYFIPTLLAALKQSAAAELVDWNAVEALSPCGGVRIEDNVHVRDDGVDNLTRTAFAREANAS